MDFILVGCILLCYVHVYLSDYTHYRNWEFTDAIFSPCLQHVSAPSGHPQVKYNVLLIYLEKAIVITTDPLFTICLLLSIYTKVSVQF
jgi:hypothetical protein